MNKYSHSILNDCECVQYSEKRLPRVLNNYTEDELNVLLQPDNIIEYRYYTFCCFSDYKILKIIHCNICLNDNNYLSF